MFRSSVVVLRRANSVLNFNDPTTAYKPKSTGELLRNLIVFQSCTQPRLVQNGERILNLSKMIIGERLTLKLVKSSFFSHFCAGESETDMQPTLRKLEAVGVGAILDYAAEKDVQNSDVQNGQRPSDAEINLALQDVNEAEYDENMKLVLSSILTAARTPTAMKNATGIAAVKVTGLGKPEMLLRTSNVLLGVDKMWIATFTPEPIQDIPQGEYRAMLSQREYRPTLTVDVFKACLTHAGVRMPEADMEAVFKHLDCGGDGVVDYLDWDSAVTLRAMSEVTVDSSEVEQKFQQLMHQLAVKNKVPLLNRKELYLAENLHQRLRILAAAACEHKVRLQIDAEQTYMQVAIDHITSRVQREYNREFPAVFITYQCYLTFAHHRLAHDLERSQREGWIYATKLVRGAYMRQERQLAKAEGCKSPIVDDAEAAHSSYNKCMANVLEHLARFPRTEVVVATHNQESTELVLHFMKENHIDPQTHGIYFSQLLGMADHLSLTLGQADDGYKVFKYVPYGPVGEVMPYLMRRAQENSDVMQGTKREVQLLWQELKRRALSPLL